MFAQKGRKSRQSGKLTTLVYYLPKKCTVCDLTYLIRPPRNLHLSCLVPSACAVTISCHLQFSLSYEQYKTLEAMFNEVKTDLSDVSAVSALEKADKISARTRGSSSPFRCIAGLVQQMNQEKDKELSSARIRIEELEALAASRYKEVNNLFQLSSFHVGLSPL